MIRVIIVIKKTIALLCAFFAALLLMQMSYAEEVNVDLLNKQTWVQYTSANFTLISDAGDKKVKKMIEELEQFRYFVTNIMEFDQTSLEEKIPVILAKSKKTYAALGIPSNFIGLFASNRFGDQVIFANAKGFIRTSKAKSNQGRHTVYHELVHAFNKNSSLGITNPPWFNEGMAEYFGTYQEKNEQIVLGDVAFLKNRFYYLASCQGCRFDNVDTESLMKTTQADLKISSGMNRKDNRFINKFYARAVALTHYLYSDKRRRRQMYTYLKLRHKGYSIDETFEYVFQMSFIELDKEVNDYINGKYMYARNFPIAKNGITFPKISYEKKNIDSEGALSLLIPNILMMSKKTISDKQRKKMLEDAKAIYPDMEIDLVKN